MEGQWEFRPLDGSIAYGDEGRIAIAIIFACYRNRRRGRGLVALLLAWNGEFLCDRCAFAQQSVAELVDIQS